MKNVITAGIIAVIITSGTFLTYLFTVKTIKPKTNQEYSLTSVMITRYDGRSGGSGVILSSSKNSSKILTNAHVCEVVANGGIVRSDYAKGIVKNYKISNVHDLCLITTNNNFKVNTVVAQDAPDIYEDATAVGHPHLLSTIVTKGHFSEKGLVTIMVGTRKCTQEDLMNTKNILYCSLFGAIPILKTYESQTASCTIMPGSSGSPVFNANGEIAGLVFAGSGDFGFAQLVPYEYISNFLEVELPNLKTQIPNYSQPEQTDSSERVNFKKVCASSPKEAHDICDIINKSLLLLN